MVSVICEHDRGANAALLPASTWPQIDPHDVPRLEEE